jgi:hypothetical protein
MLGGYMGVGQISTKAVNDDLTYMHRLKENQDDVVGPFVCVSLIHKQCLYLDGLMICEAHEMH